MKILKTIFGRFLFNIIFVILQVAFIAYLITSLSTDYFYVYLASQIISYLIVLILINKMQMPELKIPWIVFILIFPIPGVVSYLFFSRQYFPNRKVKKYLFIKNLLSKYMTKSHTLLNNEYQGQFNYIEKEAELKASSHNHLKYYARGEDIYIDLIEDIKNAKEYIFLEFFIFSKGYMLDELITLLEQKVREGVDVRIIYDDIGSMKHLGMRFNRKMEKKGIKCLKFHPFIPFISTVHNNRDHRKIIVIDGIKAYMGGINIADEYINRINPLGYWKDNGIKIEGEAVDNMIFMFLTNWYVNYKIKDDDYSHFFKSHNKLNDQNYLVPFGDGPKPIYMDYISENVYLNIINNAEKYLYITTPYLIIDYHLTNALKLAAKRGVDVRIVLPSKPDKRIVFWLAQSSYSNLTSAGIKIYQYSPGFIHSKCILTDDDLAIIGTVNFDYRSLIHHFECATLMYKPTIYQDIYQDFMNVIEESKLIDEKEAKIKNPFKLLVILITKFFSPLL